MATADLIILPLQSAAPPPPNATFYASNAHLTVRSLRHADATNTLFAEISFPKGSLSSLDGSSLGPEDSVQVTVRPEPGTYGVEIMPSGLRFASTARPTVRFSYVKYGHLTVAAGSRYADANAYAGALEVWRDVGLDLWSNVGGSGATGTDLQTSITQAGRYIVAAPR